MSGAPSTEEQQEVNMTAVQEEDTPIGALDELDEAALKRIFTSLLRKVPAARQKVIEERNLTGEMNVVITEDDIQKAKADQYKELRTQQVRVGKKTKMIVHETRDFRGGPVCEQSRSYFSRYFVLSLLAPWDTIPKP